MNEMIRAVPLTHRGKGRKHCRSFLTDGAPFKKNKSSRGVLTVYTMNIPSSYLGRNITLLCSCSNTFPILLQETPSRRLGMAPTSASGSPSPRFSPPCWSPASLAGSKIEPATRWTRCRMSSPWTLTATRCITCAGCCR